MTTQYNVPIKVADQTREYLIQHELKGYRVFTDGKGNLDRTAFSREFVPYVGEVVVVKSLKQEAAQTAYNILSKIEGLVVLPVTESVFEEDGLTSKVLENFRAVGGFEKPNSDTKDDIPF